MVSSILTACVLYRQPTFPAVFASPIPCLPCTSSHTARPVPAWLTTNPSNNRHFNVFYYLFLFLFYSPSLLRLTAVHMAHFACQSQLLPITLSSCYVLAVMAIQPFTVTWLYQVYSRVTSWSGDSTIQRLEGRPDQCE